MSNTLDDYDYCDECGGYGDDYYINDDGELVSTCDDCPHNSANWEVKMNNTLLPCPFCGGEAEIVGGPENWTPTFYDPDSGGDPIAVVCKTCACGLHFFDGYAEAASAWNRRADHVRDTTKMVSNADRIRSMSDDELARFLWEQNGGNRYWKSVEKYLDWLKQPVKEE